MQKKKYRNTNLRHLLSIPFLWGIAIPIIILDIFLEIYHIICFPLYRMPYVKRSNYIRIDRHKLRYLGYWDKFNCLYCGYGNGVIHYASEIGAQSENYWCGIKHKNYPGFVHPNHHKNFVEYGNEEEFKKRYG